MSVEAEDLIRRLQLSPHPEGGWYRELFRSKVRVAADGGVRSGLTTIYYLLERNQLSRWHVVTAAEIWHFYAGAPLELLTYDPATRDLTRTLLGSLVEGHQAVGIVEADVWQAARSTGAYSLIGCSVGPGFDFADFQFISALPDYQAHFTGELRAHQGLI
jgi:predicted cupin superfamily sugar epimerase